MYVCMCILVCFLLLHFFHSVSVTCLLGAYSCNIVYSSLAFMEKCISYKATTKFNDVILWSLDYNLAHQKASKTHFRMLNHHWVFLLLELYLDSRKLSHSGLFMQGLPN